MANQYLAKIGIDLDQEQIDKVTGAISDQLVEMGELSEEFIDNALETARKYNDEIDKQRKLIDEINQKLKQSGLSAADRQLLEQTKGKAEQEIKNYTYGNVDKGLLSKKVVEAIAAYAGQGYSKEEIGEKVKWSEAIKNTKGYQALDKFGGKIDSVSNALLTAKTTIEQFSSEISEFIDQMANYANQLNPLGAFGSQSQRDLMSRYGMSGTQALGFANILDAMGMSEHDIGKMTAEQREVFGALTDFWETSIGSLDPDKLERYNKTMQEYQEIQAKFNLGMQTTVLKLVSESATFERFMGKAEDFMESFLDFLGSPLVQKVFDGLLDFLSSCMSILSWGMDTIGGIFGKGSSSSITTNNNNNSRNTFNIYGSDYRSNDELARQISYSTGGGYQG